MASAKPTAFKTARSRPLSLIRRIQSLKSSSHTRIFQARPAPFFTPGARAVTSQSMAVSEDQIKDVLKTVKYPGFSRDIVSFGLVKGIEARNGNVTVQLALATNDPVIPQTIKNEAENALRNLAGVREAKVRIDIQAPPAGSGGAGVGATKIAGIKHVVAI